jgi:IPT/TIG domain-containing protein
MHARLIIACIIINLLASAPSFGAAGNQKGEPKAGQPKEDQAPPVTIMSIIPAQGEPGTSVTLSGSGFTDKSTVFLGNNEVPTEVLGPKQLSFTIPKLPSGLYALFVKTREGTTSRAYNFNLLAPKPVVDALSSDTVYACAADRDREVIISGQNFREKSQVLFDGAAIKGRFLSEETLAFTVPHIAAGLHQVQVRNPEDTVSGTQGLIVDGRPEIQSITTGAEYVNYYTLVIEGRNFRQDSVLVVTEERDLEQTGLQPAYEVKRLRSGTASAIDRERVIFANCTQLIYQRHPYSTTPKNFTVQVVNPGGEDSSIVRLSAP